MFFNSLAHYPETTLTSLFSRWAIW